MSSCIKLPHQSHAVNTRGVENGIQMRCPNGPAEPRWICSSSRSNVAPLSDLQIAQAQVHLLLVERNHLRDKVAKLSIEIQSAGQKRKEPSSDISAPTRDPRKKPRILSPEEQLHDKIALQEQRISELEGDLFKAVEETKTRRNSDEFELLTVRTCLKNLIDKAEVNQELIRKLEVAVDLKEKATQSASVALDSRMKELSSATTTISKLTNRVKYLEHDRKYLRADASRIHVAWPKERKQSTQALPQSAPNRSASPMTGRTSELHIPPYRNRVGRTIGL
ncbi:hypothetical protein B0H13DRAFT_2655401 [Mycena leptocephala]|nr:hypothetical protein B0H13DRAFT_2655401 [Mycena leptocephala]